MMSEQLTVSDPCQVRKEWLMWILKDTAQGIGASLLIALLIGLLFLGLDIFLLDM